MRRAGSSLVETAAAVLILAVLMAIVLPVLHAGKARAKTADTIEHMRQLGQAASMYTEREGVQPLFVRPLVDSGLVPKSLCVSPLDMTPEGIQAIVEKRSSFGKTTTPFRVSYVGLLDLNWEARFLPKFEEDANSGWLVDLSLGSEYGMPGSHVWEGRYLRLRFDGSVAELTHPVRFDQINGQSTRVFLPSLWFSDKEVHP